MTSSAASAPRDTRNGVLYGQRFGSRCSIASLRRRQEFLHLRPPASHKRSPERMATPSGGCAERPAVEAESLRSRARRRSLRAARRRSRSPRTACSRLAPGMLRRPCARSRRHGVRVPRIVEPQIRARRYASSWALRKRIFDHRCPARLRRRSKSRARAGSKNTTASAHSAPFLVAPSDSTSTPLCQVAAAAVQPRCTSALANRAPSMCTGGRVAGPRRRARTPRATRRPCPTRWPDSSSRAGLDVVHAHVLRKGNRARRVAPALILPSAAANPINLAPPVKNSGAPHSSVTMCAAWWQYTAPKGGVICAAPARWRRCRSSPGRLPPRCRTPALATLCSCCVRSSPP